MTISGTTHIVPPPTRLETSITPKTRNSNVSNHHLNSLRLIHISITESHLTDNEIERIKKAQEEEFRKKLHSCARNEALDRMKNRRIERQAMQFKANQAMGEADCDQAGDLSL